MSGMHWGLQVDWEPDHIGPQHSHWFPLGSDLPHQGQARAPVEGPITPTGIPWEVTYLAKAKQVTEMSSAGYYIHLELYFMTVCTFVSMQPHTYSCMQCKEMLYGLLSLQTNLCISLHH